MMVRIVTNRIGTYISKGNKRIFIANDSVSRNDHTFRDIMLHIDLNGSDVISCPTSWLRESFAILYRLVNRNPFGEDYARATSHVKALLKGSVLA